MRVFLEREIHLYDLNICVFKAAEVLAGLETSCFASSFKIFFSIYFRQKRKEKKRRRGKLNTFHTSKKNL